MAGDVTGARTFVAQIYLKAVNDRHFSFASPRLLAPDLYNLVLRSRTQGANGVLGYDPICQCQDNDGLSAQILSVVVTDDRAVAQVLLRFDASHPVPPVRVKLLLNRAPLAGWKITDIQTQRVPSLKSLLSQRGSGVSRRLAGASRGQ
jgi:hypothetical protein